MLFSEPAYIEAFKTGLLAAQVEGALKRLEDCDLCPRKCHVNRTAGDLGNCKTGRLAMVASYAPHFGEEKPLVGTHGSGTIFFTHCNLGCTFCQNYDISHEGYGVEITDSHLARIMITLQHLGCHNINLVTPTHVVPQVLSALEIAVKNGLNIPLVYNSSGYDDPETLRLLDGIVDIYMPDFKFWDPEIARQTCNAPDYPEVARQAVKEMHRQVGDLVIINGKAVHGLLLRHLVLPYNLSGTEQVMNYISREISPSSYVNIMEQYHPCGEAGNFRYLDRGINRDEYLMARKTAIKAGLSRLD
jgi:putative pyruvate formate lyase activating enzyme